MSDFTPIEEWIREEDRGKCVADQVVMARWFCENRVVQSKDREKRTREIKDALEGTLNTGVDTVVGHLEEAGIIEETGTQSGTTYIRNHRAEKNIYTPNSDSFLPLVREEITRLLLDIRDQEARVTIAAADGGKGEATIREVAAEAVDAEPSNLEIALTGKPITVEEVPELDEDRSLEIRDPVARMENFDVAVNAIEASEDVEKGREYEPMGWRNVANRYSLSEEAERRWKNRSLSDFE